MDTKTNQTNGGLQIKDGDGLSLRGLIVSCEVNDKQWEGEQYKQLRATITNGRQMYIFSANDKRGKLPEVQVGRRAHVKVEGANREKGVMTIFGQFDYE